jgi:hypothetical protein
VPSGPWIRPKTGRGFSRGPFTHTMSSSHADALPLTMARFQIFTAKGSAERQTCCCSRTFKAPSAPSRTARCSWRSPPPNTVSAEPHAAKRRHSLRLVAKSSHGPSRPSVSHQRSMNALGLASFRFMGIAASKSACWYLSSLSRR